LTVAQYSAKLSQADGERIALERRKKIAEIAAKKNRERLERLEEAQAFLQTVAAETQGQLRFHIEDMVQAAIDACWPGEYAFVCRFETKRGRTEASLLLLKEGAEIDPMAASGGGVVDVISFALRLAAWSLSKTKPLLVFDEPFKHLSRDLRPKAAEILRELSRNLGLQIVLTTHDEILLEVADRVFENKIDREGVSRVEIKSGR
jgi:hypothetical protein